MGIFGQKLNPLQALEAAQANKAAKAKKRPTGFLIALVTLAILAFVVVSQPQNPGQDQTEAQAAVNPAEHPSTDAQSSAQPAESSARLAETFLQLAEAPAKPAAIATQPKLAKADRSPEEQKKRRALLQTLASKGIFIKAELPDNLPRLWVGPAFHSLEFDRKETYVSIVHAYYLDGSDEYASVRVFDDTTSKEIGALNLAGGLKLY
jgi:hypothetical protein